MKNNVTLALIALTFVFGAILFSQFVSAQSSPMFEENLDDYIQNFDQYKAIS